MKKIFSILCALTIVLSVSAAPQLKSGKVAHGKYHFELAKKMIAEQGSIKKARFQKAATEITIVDCSAEYYEYYGDYVYTMIDADGIEYYFAFPSTGTDVVVSGQTYTLTDMDAEETYWMDWDSWDYAQFTAVTFVKTDDGEGGTKIVVNATDENGTEFVLTYEFKVTGETIVIEVPESVTKPEYYDEDGDWYFGGHNSKYEFTLDIYGDAESLVGTYAFADFYTYYTYITDRENDKEITVKNASATVTAGTNDTLLINAEILGSDGVKYVIKAFYATPTAQAQETITSENLEITKDEYSSGFYTYDEYIFSASDDKNTVDILWIDDDEVGSYLGTFDVTKLTAFSITPAGKDYSEAFSGSITIASANGKTTITGTVLCYNNVEYTLNLSCENQGIEDIELGEKAQKVVVDGVLYIVRDGKMYNIQGAQVR